jgi:hypothetical protein
MKRNNIKKRHSKKFLSDDSEMLFKNFTEEELNNLGESMRAEVDLENNLERSNVNYYGN